MDREDARSFVVAAETPTPAYEQSFNTLIQDNLWDFGDDTAIADLSSGIPSIGFGDVQNFEMSFGTTDLGIAIPPSDVSNLPLENRLVFEGNSVIFGNDHLENVTLASGDLGSFSINVVNGDIVKLENPDPSAQDTDLRPIGINNSTVTDNTFIFGDDTIIGARIENLEFATESEGANLIGDSSSLSIRLTAGETENNILDYIPSLPASYENEVSFTNNSFILGDDDISGFGNIAGDIADLEISLSPSVFFLTEAAPDVDINGDGILDYFLDIDGDGELDLIVDLEGDGILDATFIGLNGNDGLLGYAYHYKNGFNLFLVDDGGLLKVVLDTNADNILEETVPNGSFVDISGTQIEFGRDTLESQGAIIDNDLLDIPDSPFFDPVLIGDVSQASFSDPDIGLRSTVITFRGETLVFNEGRELEQGREIVLLNDPIILKKGPITQNDESISGMSAFNELFRPSDGTREFDSYYSYSSDGANSRISFAEDIFVFNGNADTSVDYIIQDYRVTPVDEEHVVVEPDFLRFDGVTNVADIAAEFSDSADGEIVMSTLSSTGETTTITFNGYQYADYAGIELIDAVPEHASDITDGVYATLALESAYVFDAFSLPDMPRYLPNLDGTGRATRLIPEDDQLWVTNLGSFYSEELTIEQAYGEVVQFVLGRYAPDPAAPDEEIDVYKLTFFSGTVPSALIPVLTDGPTYVPITFDRGTSGDEAVQYTLVLGTDANGDELPSSKIGGEELGSTIYYGFGGDDVFNGGSEEDIIDPGEGMDTARYNEDLVLFEARNYLAGPVNIGGRYMELANAVMMGNLFNYDLSLEPSRLIVEDRTPDRDGRDSIVVDTTTEDINIAQLERIIFNESVFMEDHPYDLYIRGQNGPILNSNISTPNQKLIILGELNADLDLSLSLTTNDVVIGANNTGADTITVNAGDGNDVVSLGNNKANSGISIGGDEGNDILKGGDNDGGSYTLNGGDGDDILVGGNNSNGGTYVLNGDDNSLAFVDYLKAGNNDDADGSKYYLNGGLGDDILETGGGTQILDGGEGEDIAIYHADILVEEARAFINGTNMDARSLIDPAMNGGLLNYDLRIEEVTGEDPLIIVEDLRPDSPDGTDQIQAIDSTEPFSIEILPTIEKINFHSDDSSLTYNLAAYNPDGVSKPVNSGENQLIVGSDLNGGIQDISFTEQSIAIAGDNKENGASSYTGSDFNDVIKVGNTGEQASYTVDGGGGNDILIGGENGALTSITIYGGAGNDFLSAAKNNINSVTGNTGDYNLEGGPGDDTYVLGDGDFSIFIALDFDDLFGDDTVFGFDAILDGSITPNLEDFLIVDNIDSFALSGDLEDISRVVPEGDDMDIKLEIFDGTDEGTATQLGSITFVGISYVSGSDELSNYIDAAAFGPGA